jgi:hypothetical protein
LSIISYLIFARKFTIYFDIKEKIAGLNLFLRRHESCLPVENMLRRPHILPQGMRPRYRKVYRGAMSEMSDFHVV